MKPFPGHVTPLGDTRYNLRHEKRNVSRVKSIVKYAHTGNTALDIGCNAGYFSTALLENGLAKSVTGIELDPNIVSQKLINDGRFTLHAGDAVTFPFKIEYDIAIYGAVHHHLFARHGYKRAMQFWNDVIDHTKNQIFLETGQLAEGSRWYWQRAMRLYFPTDEDFFFDLLTAAGPRLKDIRIIDRFWIHGVQRWLLCIELFPHQKQTDFVQISSAIVPRRYYARTIGSKNQKLVAQENAQNETVHEGMSYCIADMAGEGRVFCKNYTNVNNLHYEYCIAQQVNDHRFVSPLGVNDAQGLVFPYIDLPTLENTERHLIRDKKALTSELFSIFDFAENKTINVEFGNKRHHRLIDIIDLHAGNLFVDINTSSVLVFDLELFSCNNSHRNNMHLAKMVWRYGDRNVSYSLIFIRAFLFYFISAFFYSFRQTRRRILERTPSVFGYIYIRSRELVDRALARILPQYRE